METTQPSLWALPVTRHATPSAPLLKTFAEIGEAHPARLLVCFGEPDGAWLHCAGVHPWTDHCTVEHALYQSVEGVESARTVAWGFRHEGRLLLLGEASSVPELLELYARQRFYVAPPARPSPESLQRLAAMAMEALMGAVEASALHPDWKRSLRQSAERRIVEDVLSLLRLKPRYDPDARQALEKSLAVLEYWLVRANAGGTVDEAAVKAIEQAVRRIAKLLPAGVY